MKAILMFIITITLFSSCTSKEAQLKAFIENELSDTLQNQESYKFVSLSRLTPIFRPYCTTEGYKRLIKKIRKISTGSNELSTKEIASLEKKIDSLEQCNTNGYKRKSNSPFGYYCILKYKIKKSHDKEMLVSRVVFVDKTLKTISIEDFSDNRYQLPFDIRLKSSIKFFYIKCESQNIETS